MFRFWVAGAAISSFVLPVLSCSAAELFESGAAKAAGTSTIGDTTVDSPIVTPTKNATSSFSGATGLGTVVPLNQTWSAPAARPLTFASAPTPVVTAASTVPNDLALWTNARLSVSPYVSPSTLPITTSVVSPSSAAYFTPLKTRLFASPMPLH